MSTISTYITTVNALFFQSTLEQTIRQALLFSDEVIVCPSILTNDGTCNLLDSLHSEYYNIIKIYPYEENYMDIANNQDILAHRRNFGLERCTKDYCILQDDDNIKHLPDLLPETMAFRFNTIHFYRSYTRYQNSSGWYPKKIYMIKNIPSIKHGRVGNDPDNYIVFDNKINRYTSLDSYRMPNVVDTLDTPVVDAPVTVYHYGWCRNDAILLMKKYFQEVNWWGRDYWKYHEFPFKFDDPNTLSEFKDSHPKYMIHLIEQEKRFNSRHIKEISK